MMIDPPSTPTKQSPSTTERSSTAPTTLPRKPAWAETKVRVYRQWFAVVGFDLGNWVVGFGFGVAPTSLFVNLGPFFAAFERDEPPPSSYDDLPDWSWTLYRIVIKKWKLDLRLELDFNIWRIGYIMGDVHDHVIYFGPINLQVEYVKLFDEPYSLFFRKR
jgi:hypothetical protein